MRAIRRGITEGVPPEFGKYLSALTLPRRILIPGCGSAHDLHAALDHGHDAIGIDLSREAVMRAREMTGAGEERHLAVSSGIIVRFGKAKRTHAKTRRHEELTPMLQTCSGKYHL